MVTAQLSGLIPASVVKFADNQGLANQTAVIAIPAVINKRIVIMGIQGSYSAVPTGGRVHVTDGSDTFFELDIFAAGPFFLPISIPLPVGKGVVITVAAGGGTVVSKVNAQWIEYAE